jgi:glycosyltransferase involved in cell wall biosynthesis
MKILHWQKSKYPAKDSNGTERVVEYLIKGQYELGHDVFLRAAQGSTNPFAKIVTSPPKDVDIIHFHGYNPHGDPCDNLGIPFVKTIHGGGTESDPSWLRVAKECGKIICISQFISNRIQCPPFVRNCVDPSQFTYKENKENYFLWLAGTDWGEGKGLFTTIMLAKKLKFNLVVAGTGRNQQIINQIKSFCDNRIQYIGAVNGARKAEVIASAKALFHLSKLGDGCPLTVSESQVSGTPVIAYPDGALPEMVIDGKTGFLCDSESDIVKAIAKIKKIKSYDCRENALNKFHYIDASKKYVYYYEQMTKNGRLY